jgi:hypothetical protein
MQIQAGDGITPKRTAKGGSEIFCKPKDISWPVVLELPARLAKVGFKVVEKTVTIRRYPVRSTAH